MKWWGLVGRGSAGWWFSLQMGSILACPVLNSCRSAQVHIDVMRLSPMAKRAVVPVNVRRCARAVLVLHWTIHQLATNFPRTRTEQRQKSDGSECRWLCSICVVRCPFSIFSINTRQVILAVVRLRKPECLQRGRTNHSRECNAACFQEAVPWWNRRWIHSIVKCLQSDLSSTTEKRVISHRDSEQPIM